MRDLLVLRHGQSEWNAIGRWQGWIDIDLTAQGTEEARKRGRDLARSGAQFVGVFSSDLRRARHTAELISAELSNLAVTAEPGFRERCGGDWQGLTTAEIEARFPAQLAAWRAGRLETPPNGESTATLLERFDKAVARAHQSCVDGPLLIVTHGGVQRVVANRAGADIHSVFGNLGGLWLHYDGASLTAGAILPTSAEPGAVE